MPKLYFLGGEDIENKKDSRKINKSAFADAGGKPQIIVFPWTGWFTSAKKNKYRRSMEKYFLELGAKKVIFAELTDSLKTLKKKINSSDLVYLPGGEPKMLVKRLRKRKLISLLKKYNGVIIGNSAGTLSMCKKYAVIKGQDHRPKTALERGLGLVDFTVSVHYGSPVTLLGGISPDKELKKLSRKVKIYAIPEQSALVYDGKKIKSIGVVYLFEKGKKKKCQQ